MRTDLHDPALIASRIHHRSPFENGVSHRFFHVDIRPRIDRRNRDQGMPVVGGGIDDNLGLFLVDQFAKILIDFGRIRRELFLLTLDSLDLLQINVTQGHDLTLSRSNRFANDIPSPPATADQCGSITFSPLGRILTSQQCRCRKGHAGCRSGF